MEYKEATSICTGHGGPVTNVDQPATEVMLALQSMPGLVSQLADLIVAMDARLRQVENAAQQRITVTSTQAKAISEAVIGKARAICSTHGINYSQSGRKIREAIWADIRKEFAVTSHHDIPAKFYTITLDMVGEWSNRSLVRQIQQKERQC